MSQRRAHISPAIKVSPAAIHQAISQVAQVLDLADYHADSVISAYLTAADSLPEQAYAWMMTAILIADIAEVDSMTLRSLQNTIHKGTQDALWY